MSDADIAGQMRRDWNERARQDANYFVAFGRRGQSEAEFFGTGAQLVQGLEAELKRLGPGDPASRRALEIGCGPGRLMRPMSRHFGEIHGVDVSDEMIHLARERLADIPGARATTCGGAGLEGFAGGSFDFVYSYAVYQHIPSREVVFNYLRETRRVLKTGGIARFQVNGLPETAARYDTWAGVRIRPADLAAFARDSDFQLLALEGAGTQYLWTTWRKMPEGWTASLPKPAPPGEARIRRITNAHSSEPVAPNRGRFACISIGMEGVPEDCDLNHLEVRIAGRAGACLYLAAPQWDGLRQLNVMLPKGVETGLQPVEAAWLGAPLAPPALLRVVPPGPAVPRVVAVSDGIDLLSGPRISSGIVKVTLEEAEPADLRIQVDGRPVEIIDTFCTDPIPPRHEINVRLEAPTGAHRLEMWLGRRRFAPLEVVVESAP